MNCPFFESSAGICESRTILAEAHSKKRLRESSHMSQPSRATSLLLNVGHGIDHMFLLIFATAVAAIATDFGYAKWEDLMPYAVGAFVLFGLGALPAGRLG